MIEVIEQYILKISYLLRQMRCIGMEDKTRLHTLLTGLVYILNDIKDRK